MTAMLMHDNIDVERTSEIIAECRRMDIKVLPPDVNASELHFTASPRGILFGVGSVKNVGNAAQFILDARKTGLFISLEDMIARVNLRKVNIKSFESLIKGGALDCFGDRAQLVHDVGPIMESTRKTIKGRGHKDQINLFDDNQFISAKPQVKVEPWSKMVALNNEHDMLGFYVSGHPLEDYAGHYDDSRITTIAHAINLQIGEVVECRLAGLVTCVTTKYVKSNGTKFGIIKFEDFTGTVQMLAWDKRFTDNSSFWKEGNVLLVMARLRKMSDGQVRVSAQKVALLPGKTTTKPIRIRMQKKTLTTDKMNAVMSVVKRFPGIRPVLIDIVSDVTGAAFVVPCALNCGDEIALRNALAEI